MGFFLLLDVEGVRPEMLRESSVRIEASFASMCAIDFRMYF
ncbi:hypothetical protein MKY84_04305 [Chryseomicrobium sp. FSL W7-1435]